MGLVREGIDLFLSERFSVYRNVAAVIGSFVLLRFSLRTLSGACQWLRAYILAPLGIGRTNLKKYGPWAVVTGASEGIGRGYALELARQGLNVILMSRSQTKLDKVAEEIRERYSRQVRVVPVDFSQGPEIYPRLAESVQDLDIGILVNNVGYYGEHPDLFLDAPIDRLRKMVEINIQATMHVTHLIMPKMVAKKRGIVVNLSSAAAIMPSAFASIYGATKMFVEFFTISLSLEYAGKGIIVQTVAPFYVATAMSGKESSWTTPDANQYARAAVATIGIMSYTHSVLPHAIQGILVRAIPHFLLRPGLKSEYEKSRAQFLEKRAKGK